LFCGNYGDPGTCKDLVEIVGYIKELNPHGTIRIHTNGGMRTPAFWSKLADVMNNKTDRVIWSIDGLEDTNHMYRRNVQWDKLMANLKAYLDAGGSAVWEFLVFGHNQHQVEEARAISKELGFTDFFYKKAFGFTEEKYGEGVNSILVLDEKGYASYSLPEPDENWMNSLAIDMRKNKGSKDIGTWNLPKEHYPKIFKQNKEKLHQDIHDGQLSWLDDAREISCMSINNKEIFVDSLGGVHPCCFLGHVSQDADGIVNMQYYEWVKTNIGFENINIHNNSIEHILDNTDYFSKIEATWAIEKHKDGRIAQCTKHCQMKNNPVDSLYESARGKKTSQAN
jgi:MoaA/NifB/PqqE/SkfB family radical SAM enzyme